ncbi:uncharacterized protein KGF55_004390 [Candida pseudojiufengensis]|uniref:uncharacterized protein n=1 Tax=Candida pseudojiufengensis TaxID=497109 RepID=UPI002223FB9B|nr:uncharacterized protein KGF55_004390 [Candida pseudojiufengensis]KAI5960820.1 hypothetical protein KGF55_004390 [Candida pseudojiufengensis]
MISQSTLPRYLKPLLAILSLLILYSLYLNHNPQTSIDIIELNNQKDKQLPKLNYDKYKDIETGEADSIFLTSLDKKTKQCPDYVTYSQTRHPPYSSGKYKYPYMRPAPKCRTFTSKAVENLIDDLKLKIKDPDLARLVENCLPNTLDTTILWHKSKKDKTNFHKDLTYPQTFVVTGDIHAEWLRDSARQLSLYQKLIKYDSKLQNLILGAINTQAYYVNNSPYCNAFHPPPGSGIKKGDTAFDNVQPRPDWRRVFECKYEIDSLASFLTLTNEYFINSGDLSFLNSIWFDAYEKLLIVLRRESEPTFDEETGQALQYYYLFQRNTNSGSETLPLGGVGNPVNYGTGLIRSAFRPSDDSCILQFFIPGNIHMLTELKNIRKNFLNEKILKKFDDNAQLKSEIQILIKKTDFFINSISNGIEKFGIVNHPKYGKVFAYEVDGYGSAIFMDDANVPSLLALPDLGFTTIDHEIYRNTRKMILSKDGNPYYLKGKYFEGIGGPHVGIRNAWPMSLLIRIRTSNNDEEILQALNLIMETTGDLGLIHESINVNSKYGMDFTRSWFSWANSEFSKTILYLAEQKPHLIFKDEFKSIRYDIDKVLSSQPIE